MLTHPPLFSNRNSSSSITFFFQDAFSGLPLALSGASKAQGDHAEQDQAEQDQAEQLSTAILFRDVAVGAQYVDEDSFKVPAHLQVLCSTPPEPDPVGLGRPGCFAGGVPCSGAKNCCSGACKMRTMVIGICTLPNATSY